MSGLKIDMKKLKFVHGDDKSTTLQHPEGHTITVAHAPLSKEARAQLKALSPIPSQDQTASQKAEARMAEGGEAKKPYGSVSVRDMEDKRLGSVKVKETPKPQGEHPYGKTIKKFADGGETDDPQDKMDTKDAPDNSGQLSEKDEDPENVPKGITINVGGQPLANTATQAAPAPGQVPYYLAPNKPEATPAPQAQPEEAPAASETQPQPQEAPAAPASQPQVPAPTPVQQDYSDLKSHAFNELQSEDQAWNNDLHNGHVTPETYSDLFAKKSTLGKIGSIFGLLVSGAGSGLSHQSNAMLDAMNREIAQDLEAQKTSKENAQNFLRIHQQNQLNMANIAQLQKQGVLTEAQAKNAVAEANTKAYALSRMQLNSAALHKLTQQVQQYASGSPERARAEQALGILSQTIQGENYDLADKAAAASAYYKLLGLGEQGQGSSEQQFQQQQRGRRLLGPQGEKIAEDTEAKHFPGLKGQASVSLNGADREALNSGIDFDQKLHRFMDWTQKHSGDISPSDRHKGEALAAELQGAYRQATHGGVYKEGEQNFISRLIDSTPTKFFNSIRVMPQLQAIAGENSARVNQLAKSKGFEGYESPSAQGSMVTVISPSGKRGSIPKENLEKARKLGYKVP